MFDIFALVFLSVAALIIGSLLYIMLMESEEFHIILKESQAFQNIKQEKICSTSLNMLTDIQNLMYKLLWLQKLGPNLVLNYMTI